MAQCLSTIHVSVLPLRSWHLLSSSPVFCHEMHTSYCISVSYFTQSCTVSYKLNRNTIFVHSFADRCFLPKVFTLVLAFSGENQSCLTQIKTYRLCWGCSMCTNGCCMLPTHSLTDEVIITCRRPPLLSHWSRSPDSCPCSLPAPGHSQKSPYKCSHTSHLQSLLTPSGRGTLQDRHM